MQRPAVRRSSLLGSARMAPGSPPRITLLPGVLALFLFTAAAPMAGGDDGSAQEPAAEPPRTLPSPIGETASPAATIEPLPWLRSPFEPAPTAPAGTVPPPSEMPSPIGETASPAATIEELPWLRSPFEPAPSAPADTVPPPSEMPAPLGDTASAVEVPSTLERVAEEGELHPCWDRPGKGTPFIDRVRSRLHEWLCRATLGVDGWFGDERNIENARASSGRIESSFLNSDYEGSRFRTRASVRVELPNLDRRIHAFLDRDDQEAFIEDRTEGLAQRSQFINVETNEGWLAGLGYGLPGNYKARTDFRVGGKLGNEPKIFVQGRHRRNIIVDRRNIWRLRETLFWENREGFGSTTSVDYDFIVNRLLLFRWASIGTITEETKGFEYRTAFMLYHDLPGHRAVAYDLFLRGWTEAETDIREYGGRVIYRQSLARRNWLDGEIVIGYSWPREKAAEERKGSLTLGLGFAMRFGPKQLY